MKSKEFENNTQAHHQLHNDVGFVNELSEEMGVGQADAERIIMTQGLKGLDNLCMEDDEAEERHIYQPLDAEVAPAVQKKLAASHVKAKEIDGAEANAAAVTKKNSQEAGGNSDKLWTSSYIFDICINFFVYIVHFQLMLWSTSYSISKWNVELSTAGLASGLFIVGALLARLPAGRYIDFIGRRKMFLAGTACYFLFVLAYLFAPSVQVFMAVRLLHGLAFGSTSTAASTIVAAIVPIKKMGTGIGYFTLGVTLASAVGPLLALTFINGGDFNSSIYFCGALTLVIFVLSTLIKVPERTLNEYELSKLKSVSWRNFISKNAIGISLVAFIGGICYSTVLSYLGEYAAANGMGEIGGQLFFLFFAATSFLSRPLTGWLLDNKGGNIVLYPSLILLVLSMLTIAVASNDYILLAGGLLLGGGYGSITAACHALAVHCAPSHQIGVATSTYFVLLDLGIGVGPYCLGSVVPAYGFSAVYFCAAIVSVIGLVLYFMSMGRYQRFSLYRMNRERDIKSRAAARAALEN